jgi:hypothetical protein
VTHQRLIAKQGILNKTEIALPLHFVQDASVYRTWRGVGHVKVSTAGGPVSTLNLYPLKAEDARRVADTIVHEAKRAGRLAPRSSHDAVTDNLERLAALRALGALTDEEFEAQKARLLDSQT